MSKFLKTLRNIDWNERKEEFFKKEGNQLLTLEENLKTLAHWAQSLETIYQDNPALPFVREAQISAQDFISMYSLGMYKNSASSMRTVFESILYFSYFKDHSIELKSVSRDKFHLSRSQIISYHERHTENFASIYKTTNLGNILGTMYSDVSNIVHSSQPGIWHQEVTLGKKTYNNKIATETANLFTQTIEVINLLLLCTLTYEEWLTVPIKSRKVFLKGLSPEQIRKISKQIV